MYLLYIDESIKNNRYVLGAVLIVDSKIRKLENDFEKFWMNDLGFKKDHELHSDSVWNGREPFNKLSMDQRAEAALKIANWLSEQTITRLYAGMLSIGGTKPYFYLYILEQLIDDACKFVSKASRSSRQLMIVFDQRHDIKDDIKQTILEKRARVIEKYKKSCHIVDSGYEGESKHSRLLQFADYVAYFVGKHIHLQREQDLFKKSDPAKLINCIDVIRESLKKKLKIIKR